MSEEETKRLAAFEAMLDDLQRQAETERVQMEQLKAEGKEKTATYRQFFGNRLFYRMMLDRYRKYGLLKEAEQKEEKE